MQNVEPVEEIRPELPLRDLIGQVAVGRRDHANIGHRLHAVRADAPDLPVLEEPQHQRLHPQAGLADFVQENRSVVRQFEKTWLVPIRAGETAAHVAEELGLQQRIRHRRAIQRDELHGATTTLLVNHLRDDFLANPALPCQKNFRV